jgi:hypothetical protein
MMRGGVDWNCFVAPAQFDKPVRAANGLAIHKFVQVVGYLERLQRGPTGQVRDQAVNAFWCFHVIGGGSCVAGVTIQPRLARAAMPCC